MSSQESLVRTKIDFPEETFFFQPHNQEAFRKPALPLEVIPYPMHLLSNLGGWGLVGLAFACTSYGYATTPHWIWLLVATGIILGGAFPFLRVAQRNATLNKRAMAKSDILKGEVSSCIREEGLLSSRPSSITTIYLFANPAGTHIRRTTTQKRPDLKDRELPEPGTPVYLLYFNDDEYYLL